MEICMQDLAVARTWTEQEMVCSFAGGEVPGTPDGMFETDNGDLHCVQVVRVPVLTTMTGRQMSDRLYDTVLVKIVKSQAWMQSTKIVPCSFAIFCWLLPSLPARNLVVAVQKARDLVKKVRGQGWPFVLKLAVAAEPTAMFPARFASQRVEKLKKITEADLQSW
mmetsp:Transcript_11802/g.16910  ORF Transcript_11802/g.16910 Transcript_11802/m.16910 type:complete len:165 (+) Transcript_11802:87-581(+)